MSAAIAETTKDLLTDKLVAPPPQLRLVRVGNLDKSLKIGKLAAALAKAQLKVKHPPKDKKARIKTKAGGEYEYMFADLPAVLDASRPLAAEGIAIIQNPSVNGNLVYVTTILLIDDGEDGQWVAGTLFMSLADDRPQTVGSAITYARRYAIQALVGIAAEQDDDGGLSQNGVDEEQRKRLAAAAADKSSKAEAPGKPEGQGQGKKGAEKKLTHRELIAAGVDYFKKQGVWRDKLEKFLNVKKIEDIDEKQLEMLREIKLKIETKTVTPEMVFGKGSVKQSSDAVDSLNDAFT